MPEYRRTIAGESHSSLPFGITPDQLAREAAMRQDAEMQNYNRYWRANNERNYGYSSEFDGKVRRFLLYILVIFGILIFVGCELGLISSPPPPPPNEVDRPITPHEFDRPVLGN